MVSYTATENSIRATWSSLGESGNVVLSYSIELYRGYSDSGSPVDSAYGFAASSRAVNFYNLSPGTAYFIKLWGNMQNGSRRIETTQAYTESIYIPPPSSPTNFRVYDRGPGYIGATWNAVSNANGYSIEAYHSANGSLQASAYGFSGTARILSGLVSGVSYDLKVWAYNDGGNSSSTWLYGIKAGNTRPSNWTLFTNYTSGQSISISASTWNSFITRIQDFYTYRDLNPTMYSFTTAYTGNNITAAQINQARAAIAYLSPSTNVPAAVSTGGTVLASTIRGLQNSLNSVA
ncbi:MAG: fibronectin type III domain-containing protein [Psychrobacillus sp.]